MKNKKDWIDRLIELGYTKDVILSILIQHEQGNTNLINIVELLNIKEEDKNGNNK